MNKTINSLDLSAFKVKSSSRIDFTQITNLVKDVRKSIVRRYVQTERQYHSLEQYDEKNSERVQWLQKMSQVSVQHTSNLSLQLQNLQQKQEIALLKLQNQQYENEKSLANQRKVLDTYFNDYLKHFLKFYIPLKVLLSVQPGAIVKKQYKPFVIQQQKYDKVIQDQLNQYQQVVTYRKLATSDTIWPDVPAALGESYKFVSAYDENLFKNVDISCRYGLEQMTRIVNQNGISRVLQFSGVHRVFHKFEDVAETQQ